MDLLQTSHNYINRMVGTGDARKPAMAGATSKIKVLLLDQETTAIISMCTTQSTLLKHEVYLVDRIDNAAREKMRHLKCLCFLRPTGESIQWLIDEIRNPKYSSYELYFSNIAKKSQLERLAETDDYEIITRVQEMFCDYLVVNRDLFTLNLSSPHTRLFSNSGPDSWYADSLNRSVEGLVALLLTMKQKPLIRYDRNSSMAKKLATEISYTVKQEHQLFDFRRPDTPPILLIIDRRNDPVTPLLTPWTYQAMVHELLGITNNRVDLSSVPEVSQELKEIVLSADQDPFFAKTMYLNFGDLGASIKDYVTHYQSRTKSNSVIESIADMKRFVEDYPEFRRLAGNVSKHVTLVSELSRLVSSSGNLLEVSELEQSLACNDNHNSDLKKVQQMLVQEAVSPTSKLRLVALYALRYQFHTNNATQALLGLFASQHPEQVALAEAVKTLVDQYAGGQQRQENLFGSSSFLARAQSGFKGLKGVENVYTQHDPLLKTTLTNLVKGKLRKATHPFLDPGDGSLPSWASSSAGVGIDGDSERPQDIIVFIVGGTTYEEARVVAELNASIKGVRIALGGTSIHNSRSFLADIQEAGSVWPPPPPTTASERLASRVA